MSTGPRVRTDDRLNQLNESLHGSGGSPFIVVVVLLLGCLAISVWAFMDAASTPEEGFRAVGRSKTAWTVGIAVGTLVLGLEGTALAIYFLLAVRPRIHAPHLGGVWLCPRTPGCPRSHAAAQEVSMTTCLHLPQIWPVALKAR